MNIKLLNTNNVIFWIMIKLSLDTRPRIKNKTSANIRIMHQKKGERLKQKHDNSELKRY